MSSPVFARVALVSLLIFQLVVSPAVGAASVNYTPSDTGVTGSLSGQATVNRVGPVKLPRGTAVINENKIDLLFESIDFTQKNLPDDKKALTGTAFKLDTSSSGNDKKISGLVFFQGGSKLGQLAKPNSLDRLKLVDGTAILGTVTSATGDEITFISASRVSKTYRIGQIAEISSPQVYRFEIPVETATLLDSSGRFSGESGEIVFVSTYDGAKKKSERSQASTTSAGMSRGKKVALVVIAGLLIATAIAVPIAVAVGTGGHGNNDSAQKLANAILLQQLNRPAPPPPPSKED